MMRIFLLVASLALWGASAFALAPGSPQDEPREKVEAKIRQVFARMDAIRSRSPFDESEHPRQTMEKLVADPSGCKGRTDDKYCRVYDEVLSKKAGLKPEDVFPAFTAEEIIRYKLLGSLTGCTGDMRVFQKLAGEVGLKIWRVGSIVSRDYYVACYKGDWRLARRKPGMNFNGHGAIAVGWGGSWHLLNTSDYHGMSYARSGPGGPELAFDRPKDFLGKEVYFGFPDDPYLVNDVKDIPDTAYTFQSIEHVDGDSCPYEISIKPFGPWTGCRFLGQTRFDKGVSDPGTSLDFSCGRCYVHDSLRQDVTLSTDTVCSVTRDPRTGGPNMLECACVSCADGKKYVVGERGCD